MGTVNILFTGGEPFIRDDFLDILSYARKNGFTVSIISNGSLINEKIANKLRELYVVSVAITVHSMRETVFDKITGVKGSFLKTMSAIKFLRQNEVPVKIKCNFVRENYDEISDLWDFAENLGYLFHYGSSLMPREDGYCGFKSSCLSQDQRKSVLKLIEARTKSKGYYEKEPDKTVCNLLKNSMTINAYGDVVPCFNLKTKNTNVLRRDLKDIWYNSPELEEWKNIKWKDMYADEGRCSECKYRSYCFICLADNFLITNDKYKVNEGICQAAKIAYNIFEPARRQAVNKEEKHEEATMGKT